MTGGGPAHAESRDPAPTSKLVRPGSRLSSSAGPCDRTRRQQRGVLAPARHVAWTGAVCTALRIVVAAVSVGTLLTLVVLTHRSHARRAVTAV